jgi:HlyD family secretion protein
MKTKQRIVGALVVVTAVAVGAFVWSRYEAQRAAGALTLYGNIDIREVELAFRVPGRLLAMDFDEGDAVEAGQRVAQIDPEPYREALAVAEARVEQAHANLEKLKSGTRPQEVQRAHAAVREAQALADNAERDFDRQSGLFAAGAASEKAVDAARARRDETAAKLVSAREALALAEEGFRSEDIVAASADLAAATAHREQAQTQLDDTELFAPSAGTLIARVLEPGSILTQGTPVYSLSLRDPIYVRAYVGEPDLGKLAPGTPVEVTTDSSDKRYQGQIGFISPRAEFTPKTVQTTDLRTDLVYRLRIVVRDGDEGLRQGMPVTVHVPLASGSTAEPSS